MQNSYQFIHIETYSDFPRKNSKRPSAEAVARECQRLEQSFPHISKPQQAQLLYGIQPMEALEKARLLAKNCKDPLGRKIRKDAQIIAFGVVSIKVESTPENWKLQEVQRWIKDTTKFLKERFGDSFVSLIAHTDEQFIHLHIGTIPQLNDDGSINLTSFHPGLEAQRACKLNKKGAKDHAYKSAMRTFQDDYYQAVGLQNGLLRFGPKRRRLSRSEWHAQRRYALMLSNIFNSQKKRIQSLTKQLGKAKAYLQKLFPSNRCSNSHPLAQIEGASKYD